MPRRADWRPTRYEAPAWGEFLRCVAREALRPRWIALLFWLLVFFGPPFAIAAVVGISYGPIAAIIAGLLGLGLYLKLIERLVLAAKNRPLCAFGDLLPLPIPAGTFPVNVTIRYGNSVTGIDEASAALVDGWLHVEGRRTSFSLQAADARAEMRRGSLQIALPEFQTVVLDLVADRGLDVHPSRFVYAASHWANARERPDGEPILPPCAPFRSCTRAGALSGSAASSSWSRSRD